jgi:hypothetical protein
MAIVVTDVRIVAPESWDIGDRIDITNVVLAECTEDDAEIPFDLSQVMKGFNDHGLPIYMGKGKGKHGGFGADRGSMILLIALAEGEHPYD